MMTRYKIKLKGESFSKGTIDIDVDWWKHGDKVSTLTLDFIVYDPWYFKLIRWIGFNKLPQLREIDKDENRR